MTGATFTLIPSTCGTVQNPCDSTTDHCQDCGEYQPAEDSDLCQVCCDHEWEKPDPSVGLFGTFCVQCGVEREELFDWFMDHIDDFIGSTEDTWGNEHEVWTGPAWVMVEMNARQRQDEYEAEMAEAEGQS